MPLRTLDTVKTTLDSLVSTRHPDASIWQNGTKQSKKKYR